MPNVSNLVKTIQDIMRKDAGTYGDAQRLEQLGWMLFLKILDDREKELELLRDDYKSPLPQPLRWRSWAADEEGITGAALLAFVDGSLLPELRALTSGGDRMAGLIRMAFEDANNYMKNGTLMRQVINKINCIDFNASEDRHLFGDIYEKLLKDLQSAGNAGEFYTPRAVTQFIVEQVNLRLDETVLDPACGTGGFLVCAIEHLRKQVKTETDERTIQECFAGIEKKHLPHVLCLTNLMLHGIDVPANVRHGNTLARPLRDWTPKERVDVIVTNPPFGGMEEDGIESNFPAEFRTRETADLFLVLLMRILKPGGRAGMVLPDGTLFGEGVKTRIKEALLNECNLHTIVRLPNGVFSPYTGIRTNLLFFTKGQPTAEIWYYEHPYPPGAKSYNKTKPIRIEEFEPERAWWDNRVENEQAWRVSIDQIRAGNFNLDLKNPHNPDAGPGDANHLLPEYEKLLAQIAAGRAALKQELHHAPDTAIGNRPIAFGTLFARAELFADAPNAMTKARELVLELAVQGKLVGQNGAEGDGYALLNQIRQKNPPPGVDAETEAADLRVSALPSNWAPSSIGEVAEIVRGVSFPGSAKSQTRSEGDVACLRTASVQAEIDWDDLIFISPIHVSRADQWVETNDIMISMANSYALVGKVAIVRRVPQKATFGAFLAAIRPILIDPFFLLYVLRSPRMQAAFRNSSSQTTNIANISLGRMRPLPFPLPPLAEQRRIVARVDQLMALLDHLEALLAASRVTAADLMEALVAELSTQE